MCKVGGSKTVIIDHLSGGPLCIGCVCTRARVCVHAITFERINLYLVRQLTLTLSTSISMVRIINSRSQEEIAFSSAKSESEFGKKTVTVQRALGRKLNKQQQAENSRPAESGRCDLE